MRRNDYKGIYLFIVLAVVLLLSGCASTSTFNAYTSQINPLIQNVKNNKLLDLKKELANKVNSADKILYLMYVYVSLRCSRGVCYDGGNGYLQK